MLVAKCIALIQNGGDDDDDGNRLRRRWLTTFKPTKKHKHTRRQHTLMPEQRSHTCNRMCTPDLNSYDFNCVVILRCFEIYQRRVRCSTTRIRARVAYSPIFNNLVICVLIAARIDWFFLLFCFILIFVLGVRYHYQPFGVRFGEQSSPRICVYVWCVYDCVLVFMVITRRAMFNKFPPCAAPHTKLIKTIHTESKRANSKMHGACSSLFCSTLLLSSSLPRVVFRAFFVPLKLYFVTGYLIFMVTKFASNKWSLARDK